MWGTVRLHDCIAHIIKIAHMSSELEMPIFILQSSCLLLILFIHDVEPETTPPYFLLLLIVLFPCEPYYLRRITGCGSNAGLNAPNGRPETYLFRMCSNIMRYNNGSGTQQLLFLLLLLSLIGSCS